MLSLCLQVTHSLVWDLLRMTSVTSGERLIRTQEQDHHHQRNEGRERIRGGAGG